MTTKISIDNIQSATLATIGSGPKVTQIQVCDANYAVLDDTAVALTGGYIKITGTGFKSGATVTVNRSQATSVTFVSSTELLAQVSAQIAGTYVVYVVNTDGSVALRVNGITFSSEPTWVTDSALPEKGAGEAISIQLSATQASTYTLAANSVLPPGLTLSSGGLLSGAVVTEQQTLYNFAVVATDTELQDSPRTFSVNISVGDAYFNSTTLLLSGSANTFVRDVSTNNFAVATVGDTKPSNFNPHLTGWSNYFDGNGDYLTVTATASNTLDTGSFTIEAWVYRTTTSADESIFVQGVSGINGFGIAVVANAVRIRFGATTLFTSTATLSRNTWYHIALVRNGATLTGYLDGISFGTSTDSSNQTATQWNIGHYGSGTYLYTGYISNVRVIKSTAVYTTNFTPPTQPLTPITGTSLLTCADNRFIDDSTGNLVVTATGDVSIQSFSPFVEPATTSGSAYFDGAGDYLIVQNNSALKMGSGNWSAEAWIYITSYALANIVISIGGSTTDWFLGTANTTGRLYIGIGTSDYFANTGPIVSKNTWNHVALVRSGTTLSTYLNGVLGNTQTNITQDFQSTGEFRIGRGRDSSTNYLTGYISNVRVVKGTALYTTNFTLPIAPLTAITNTSLLTLQSNTPQTNNQFLDSSSVNSLVTRTGNATQGTFSPYSPSGWSNYFDGTGDYLQVPDSESFTFGNGNFTIEYWVNTNQTSATTYIYGQCDSSATAASRNVYDGLVTGKISTQIYSGSAILGELSSVSVLQSGKWYHVAIVRDGTNIRQYINGIQEAAPLSVGTNSLNNSTTPFSVGRLGDYTLNTFNGYISNFRVVKGVCIYPGGVTFTPPTQPLTAVVGTSLLTCADNCSNDQSANNFLVTRGGDVRVTNFSPFKAASQTPQTYSAYFDGTGDYLTIPASTNFQFPGDFTIEGWMYFTNTAGSSPQVLFGVKLSGTVEFDVRWFLTKWQVSLNGGSGTDIGIAPAPVNNAWTHVACVRSGNSINLYVNGVKTATTLTSSATLGQTTTAASVGASNTGGNIFTGYVSNLRVVKGTAVYTANFTPPTQPLTNVPGTSLLTCQSSAFIDNSTNRSTITALGNSQPSMVNPFGSVFTKSTGYTAAEYSGSMYFDGTGDYLNGTIPAVITGDLTYEAWVYITDRSVARLVLTTRSGNTSDGFQVLVDSGGEVRLGYSGSNFINSNINTVTTNQWYHIAATRKSGTITLWVNGVSKGTATNATSFTSTVYRVGYSAENTAPMLGYISDVRMVHGQAMYTSNFVPPLAPILPIANTVLLLKGTSAAIVDATTKTVLETVGDAKISTAVSKFGGSSMYFDGTGDYLQLRGDEPIGTGDFTIEGWFNLGGIADTYYNVFSSGLFGIRYANNGFANRLQISYDFNTVGSVYSCVIQSGNNMNQWAHICWTRSGGTNRFFFNGIQQNLGTGINPSTYPLTSFSNSGNITAGGTVGSGWLGYIQDFRITKGLARYTDNFTPPTSALLKK